MDAWLSATLLAWTMMTLGVCASFALVWHRRRHAKDARALALAFGGLGVGSGLFVLSTTWPSPFLFALVVIVALAGHVGLVHGAALRLGTPRGHETPRGAAALILAAVAGLADLGLLALFGLTPVGLAACLEATMTMAFVAIGLVCWRGPREHDRMASVFGALAAGGLSIRLGLFGASLAHGSAMRATPALEHAATSYMIGASALVLIGIILWLATKEDEATWLRMRAAYDPLTSLLKRPLFFIDAQTKINAAPEQPHVIALCDIDRLESINEAHGRAAGDAVLARVGRLVWQSLPRHASAGRFGGDEIVLFFPNATLETVEPVLTALARRIAAEPFAHEQPLTVSLGQAAYVRGERLDDALILADAGLQDVKASGGDGVRSVRPDDFDDPLAMSAAGGRSVRRINRALAA